MHEQELLARIGSVGRFEVVVYQPHLEPDLTTIGIETPDERVWDLDAEDARAIARLLETASQRLTEIETQLNEPEDDES